MCLLTVLVTHMFNSTKCSTRNMMFDFLIDQLIDDIYKVCIVKQMHDTFKQCVSYCSCSTYLKPNTSDDVVCKFDNNIRLVFNTCMFHSAWFQIVVMFACIKLTNKCMMLNCCLTTKPLWNVWCWHVDRMYNAWIRFAPNKYDRSIDNRTHNGRTTINMIVDICSFNT